MASQITHGVQTGKLTTSISTPNVASSGVIFAVGTAPVQMVEDGKINEVVMANNYAEAVQKLGYSDDWGKYSLCEVIYTAFQLYTTSPVFLVNVLDPAKQKTKKTMKADVVENQVRLPLEAIAGSIEVNGLEAGKDFEAFYDDDNCIVEFLADTTGQVDMTYNEVDLAQIKKDDIIGGFSVTTHKSTGLELIDSVFPRFIEIPDLILCPNWSHDSEVAAVMSAKAENINGLFEADAILDMDTTEEGVTYYSDAIEWKKSKNFSKPNELVCFPKLALGDRIFNYSTQLAGLIAKVDNTESQGGGTPCESASNKPLQADRMVLADGSEVVVDLQQANYLNDNGIITALNFYNGFVSWGDWTACFPGNTDPVDYFYCISRMFKWVAKTVTLSYWNHVDRKLSHRLIDAILQGVNDWLNSLTAEERILGGRVEFREEENSETALMAGNATFHIYLTPPSPLCKLEYKLEYDVSYLTSLMAA
jgi:phage tail sheath protein FI